MNRNSTEWFEQLDAFVGARAELPFAWGTNDCCTFAADWVALARGEDPMADLRGLTDAISAMRVIERAGGFLAIVTSRMGEQIGGTFAQVGDVALVRHGVDRLSMGVCLGAFIAAPGEAGLLMLPITQAEAAWRV